jgi:hypothetical protein
MVNAAKEAAVLGREIGIIREANKIKGNVTLSGEVTTKKPPNVLSSRGHHVLVARDALFLKRIAREAAG